MRFFLYFLMIIVGTTSCNNIKKEPVEELFSIKTESVQSKYEKSRYASNDDTIRINDLQIVLDSILIRNSDVSENAQTLSFYGSDDMLNVYVTITNTGKETKEIPYADQIEEIRKKIGSPDSVHTGKSEEEGRNFRLGSRMFINPDKNEFVISVRPKDTLSGYYTMDYKVCQFSVISFWYSNEAVDSETTRMSMLTQMSKSYKVEGKPIFHILAKDATIEDAGFDITDLVKEES